MPIYRYQGRDQKGGLLKGELDRPNEAIVAKELFDQGITPIKISTVKLDADILNTELGQAVKPEELMMFCRQMQSLIKAGVTVRSGLTLLADTARSKPFKKALLSVREDIDSGQPLAVALRQHKKIFDKLFCGIIEIGESSGNLEESFQQIYNYLQLGQTTRKRVKSATRYPIIVIMSCLAAMLIINFVVVPNFVSMFNSMKTELPFITKILMASSNFMTGYWQWLVAVLLLVIGFAALACKLPGGRFAWDRAKLKMPIMGRILQQILLGRFARSFAIVTRSGITLLPGIHFVANSMGNEYMTAKILEMREVVERGETFVTAAKHSGLFSNLVLQMLAVGEQTGSVAELMQEIADYYEQETDYSLSNLSEVIQPILLLFVGGMVLLLALGVFLPMWDMAQFSR